MDINNPLYSKQGIHLVNALFTVDRGKFKVLLIKRKNQPYKDKWILVGGACYNNEAVENGMKREMQEKTGITGVDFQLFGVYSNPNRSPLMRMLAVAFISVIDCEKVKVLTQTQKTSDAEWFEIEKVKGLGYDHDEILADAVKYLKKNIFSSNILKNLFPHNFTLPLLHKASESILGKKIDRRNFRKKLLSTHIIEEDGILTQKGKKNAILYKFCENDVENLKF